MSLSSLCCTDNRQGMAMDQPRYDEGQWPIVLSHANAELKEPDLLVISIDVVLQQAGRGVSCRSSTCSRPIRSASLASSGRRAHGSDERRTGVLLGVAIVLATPLHRGIFKAISWLSRKPRPFEAFTVSMKRCSGRAVGCGAGSQHDHARRYGRVEASRVSAVLTRVQRVAQKQV